MFFSMWTLNRGKFILAPVVMEFIYMLRVAKYSTTSSKYTTLWGRAKAYSNMFLGTFVPCRIPISQMATRNQLNKSQQVTPTFSIFHVYCLDLEYSSQFTTSLINLRSSSNRSRY